MLQKTCWAFISCPVNFGNCPADFGLSGHCGRTTENSYHKLCISVPNFLLLDNQKLLLCYFTLIQKSAEYYSTDSISSTANIYSQGGGGKVQYDITGTICLAVYHTNNQLVVDVKSAKEIAGVNRNHLSNS